MQLHHRFYPSTTGNATPLLILHGLFGASSNWASQARKFAETQPVYTVDLRNHGQSPHADDMSFADMAGDIAEFALAESLDHFDLLGHSMGGKVAMQFALSQPQKINKLVIADIAPKAYPPRHQKVFAAVDAIDQGQPTSRQQAEELIHEILPDQATRLFLLTNLSRGENGQLTWRCNMNAIRHQYQHISDAPNAYNNNQYTGSTLFIRGAQSNYVTDDDFSTLQSVFSNSSLVTIKDAGHWLHVEQADSFFTAVQKFLSS